MLPPFALASINKLLRTGDEIFDEAVEEDELLDSNPVPKRRLKQPPPKRTGRRRTKDNLRERVLPTVVREANRVRRERGAPPISEEITPHTLRRTLIALQRAREGTSDR